MCERELKAYRARRLALRQPRLRIMARQVADRVLVMVATAASGTALYRVGSLAAYKYFAECPVGVPRRLRILIY